MTRERARVGKLAPDARQEQGAAPADAENEAVAIGLERADKSRFAFRRNGPRMREDRDVEAKPGELAFLERRKTRIRDARLRRVGDRIVDERPPRRGPARPAAALPSLRRK